MGFDAILVNTLQNEGGYTVDNGGPTNYGVTQKTYDAVAPEVGLKPKNVKDLKYGEVRKIYEKEFYEKPKINEIKSEKLQGVVFDFAVNAGPQTAISRLQSVVGAEPDGVIGKKTLKAVNDYLEKYGEDILSREVIMARAGHYYELAQADPEKYGPNMNGWLNRLANLQKQYGIEA